MRMALLLLILCGASASAQEQERKLVDRLLKPDTTLQFSGQQKKYTALAETRARKASTRAFYVSEKKLVKNFAGERRFATTSFATEALNLKSANLPAPTPTKGYGQFGAITTKSSNDTRRESKTRDYAGTRSFTGRGKSQKSLSAQSHPLTIDEVRELLNKNK